MMHQKVSHSTIVRSAHSVFICFVFIWKKNGDFYPILHKLISFYNRDEKLLLRGTDWVFKWSSLRFVFKS